MLKAFLRFAILLVVCVPVYYFGVPWLFSTSGALEVAERAVRESSRVDSLTGGVKATRLARFGSSLQTSGPDGTATIKLAIVGAERTAEAVVRFEKRLGQWSVVEMRSDLLVEH
jgi:hypothetical protein